MTSSNEMDLLLVCIARCSELICDVESSRQLQRLYRQARGLRSSLHKMRMAFYLHRTDTFYFDPAKHPGLRFLAVILYNLHATCGYYGLNGSTNWRLSVEDGAFALDNISNPFEQVAERLSHFAQTLHGVLDDETTDSNQKAEKLCGWADSMFGHWNFFQHEFGIARGQAAALSAVSIVCPTAYDSISDDVSEGPCTVKVAQGPEPQRSQVWDKIGEELAAEGISNNAIEEIADDLKACARSLVQGERPKFGPDVRNSTNHTATASKTAASGDSNPFSGASKDLFDREVVASKITAALDRIKNNFDVHLPELLVIAFQQETEEDSRNYRQVLDLIYKIASPYNGPSRLHARLAKEIQARTPTCIREIMPPNQDGPNAARDAGLESREEPVAGYLFNKCLKDWYHGKYERSKITAENFALGLSRFIGELAKFGVFNAEQIHFYIRAQWGNTMKINQLMAVCKLLKITGPMLDSKGESSDMEDHFRRIKTLVYQKKTSEVMKGMAQELRNLRSSRWRSKQSKAMDQVEEAIRKRA